MKLFSKVPVGKVKKSKFNLSHEVKLTCNFGDLIPVFWEETYPGDKFRINTHALLKLAPMQFPIMHNINVHFYHFWVPTRTIFADFEKFMTGGKDGLETVLHPMVDLVAGGASAYEPGSLADYLDYNNAGTPVGSEWVSSLPFRAYQKIWNEYFRDQNLQDEVEVPTTPGNETTAVAIELLKLRKVAWEKDYFTSALPWPQKGAEVLIPLEADVTYMDNSNVINSGGGPSVTNAFIGTSSGNTEGDLKIGKVNSTDAGANGRIENIESIENATANIESLRRSVVLQQWLEKLARSGSRMTEFVRAMFNTIIPDYRVQRPEFLGSSKQDVVISEVLSTFQNAEWAQAERAGTGFSIGNGHGYKSFFPEHGIVMSLMVIRPKRGYFQGIPKRFLKTDKFSYAWPDFAHIGEQEIYNKEIYNDPSDGLNNNVFGYIPRYAELKYRPSTVHGEFKTTLDSWHLDTKFASRPGLNDVFVQCDPDDERIWAVTDQNTHHFYVSLYHKIDAIRPLPYFGVPKL